MKFLNFFEILWLFSYQELATDSSLLTKNLPVYVIRISYSSRIKTIWIIYKLWVFCIHQIYYLFRIEIFFVHVNGHSSVNSVICSWSLRLNTKQITRIKKNNVPLPDIQDCHLLSCNRSRYGKIHALRNWSGLLQMSPCLRHIFFWIKRWHRVHTDLTNWPVLFNDWAI